MPSSWIRKRTTKADEMRYDVQYRTGGRETPVRYAGAFRTPREAKIRRDYVAGELAALRVPALRIEDAPGSPTLAEATEAWRATRQDAAESTKTYHRVAARRFLLELGEVRLDEITVQDVSAWVAAEATTHKRGSIRKSLNVLAMVLDHYEIEPNPARDRRVKLPREERAEVQPPTAAHVEAALRACAPRYRLPIVVLDATGMRVGELESLRWGDVDVPEGRWRVSRERSKTRRPRWVQVPPDVFAAVVERDAPEDRAPEAEVFPDLAQERLRTGIARACRATGTPLFSPHDLRHRRISLWHREGVPWANIGQRVGQRDLSTTADTYTHVILEGEVDYSDSL